MDLAARAELFSRAQAWGHGASVALRTAHVSTLEREQNKLCHARDAQRHPLRQGLLVEPAAPHWITSISSSDATCVPKRKLR